MSQMPIFGTLKRRYNRLTFLREIFSHPLFSALIFIVGPLFAKIYACVVIAFWIVMMVWEYFIRRSDSGQKAKSQQFNKSILRLMFEDYFDGLWLS